MVSGNRYRTVANESSRTETDIMSHISSYGRRNIISNYCISVIRKNTSYVCSTSPSMVASELNLLILTDIMMLVGGRAMATTSYGSNQQCSFDLPGSTW